MAEQYTANLGKMPPEDARRDAVHIAVAPVVAGMFLIPGEHVCLVNNAAIRAGPEHAIGVVDPFLRNNVGKGQKFWLFLYPGTITSLRHLWTHPAFDIKVPRIKDESK